MSSTHNSPENPERLATLALWAIPGVGPKSLEAVRAALGGLASALSSPVADWLGQVSLPAPVRARLLEAKRLSPLAETVLERAAEGQMEIAFPGDPAFPEGFRGLADMPPVLFHRGRTNAPRRRLAMVGSRHPDQGFLPRARKFAAEVAARGVGIVSGAAEGVDRACHFGALDAAEETWAFLGSALDELDPGQAKLLPHVLEGGGTFFSELPPGVRAHPGSFPRRNRLISAAADAVLVLRAAEHSGSLHTALAAHEQGRPLLAFPGDLGNPSAAGCNALIRAGKARLCASVEDVWSALGLDAVDPVPPRAPTEPEPERVDPSALSEAARTAYDVLARTPRSFEELMGACRLPSGALTSALCELELMGLALQRPGKLYERV